MHAWLAAAGGFLIAVLWMDLIFDMQVLKHPARGGDVPEPVLASIAAYYRRATTDSRPMSHLIGGVMVATLAALLAEIVRGDGPRSVAAASLALAGAPIALAYIRVVPNAIRLGRRTDTSTTQSALARAICRDHLLCLAMVAAFVTLQLWAADGLHGA